MSKVSCIIVDDEEVGRINLEIMVKRFCPNIEVLGMASSAAHARDLVQELKPELLFLDIQMPQENGFSLLQSLPNPKPLIVIVTAYEEYALRALKANALDYLLKPIDSKDLKALSERIEELRVKRHKNHSFQDQYDRNIEAISQGYREMEDLERIVLPVSHGYKLVELNEVRRLESSINYSHIHLVNSERILISRSLKDFEELLPDPPFCRVHTSHIINMNQILDFNTKDGARLRLKDETIIPVARRRLSTFKKALRKMNLMF